MAGLHRCPQRDRDLDDGGRWDRAVALATGSEPESSNTVFGTFDQNLAGYLDEVSQDTSSSLANEQPAWWSAPSSSSLADWPLRSSDAGALQRG